MLSLHACAKGPALGVCITPSSSGAGTTVLFPASFDSLLAVHTAHLTKRKAGWRDGDITVHAVFAVEILVRFRGICEASCRYRAFGHCCSLSRCFIQRVCKSFKFWVGFVSSVCEHFLTIIKMAEQTSVGTYSIRIQTNQTLNKTAATLVGRSGLRIGKKNVHDVQLVLCYTSQS